MSLLHIIAVDTETNFARQETGFPGTMSAGRRGILVMEEKKEPGMKEEGKCLEALCGCTSAADLSNRCSLREGRSCEETEEEAVLKNDTTKREVVANGGDHLVENSTKLGVAQNLEMTLKVTQNLTTQNLKTPRGHGWRDGETKQVKFSTSKTLESSIHHHYLVGPGDPHADLHHGCLLPLLDPNLDLQPAGSI